MSKKITTAEGNYVLKLAAEYLATQGMGDEKGNVPTGRDAAYSGTGPMLVEDWDGDTPSVMLEGGPYEWALEATGYIQERIDAAGKNLFVEPYYSFSINIYRKF